VPAGTTLPDETVIRSTNPAILASQPRLRAQLAFIPQDSRLSALEEERYDVAVLKVTDAKSDLPYAKLLLSRDIQEGEKVLTYGFPGDFSMSPNQDFSVLYMLGGVGSVKHVYWGDKFFADRPVIVNTQMEVHGGRSGSPVFVDGRVAAIVSAYAEGDVTDSYSVAIRAITRLIQNSITLPQ
jgi:S1-C subfamily serine protease